MLKITSEGRKAALDLRLMRPAAPDEPSGKVNLAVENIIRIWQETTAKPSVPPSWCSAISRRRKTKASPFIATWRQAERVASRRAKSPSSRTTIPMRPSLGCSGVRSGKVRVLFGSTQKMGSGTNVQERLIALHHLDAPWRPADVEQREGRILRQGNKNPVVQRFSLRHRRLVRRLHVADLGDEGQVHRPGDERRHDDSSC
jgi:hypothetical protein